MSDHRYCQDSNCEACPADASRAEPSREWICTVCGKAWRDGAPAKSGGTTEREWELRLPTGLWGKAEAIFAAEAHQKCLLTQELCNERVKSAEEFADRCQKDVVKLGQEIRKVAKERDAAQEEVARLRRSIIKHRATYILTDAGPEERLR